MFYEYRGLLRVAEKINAKGPMGEPLDKFIYLGSPTESLSDDGQLMNTAGREAAFTVPADIFLPGSAAFCAAAAVARMPMGLVSLGTLPLTICIRTGLYRGFMTALYVLCAAVVTPVPGFFDRKPPGSGSRLSC